MFTLGGISLVVFLMRFVIFTFQESPKYLLSKGKDKQALQVLENVARTNRRVSRVTMQSFADLERGHGQDVRSSSESSAEAGTSMILDGGNVVAPKAFMDSPMTAIKRELKRVSILFSTPTLARLTILVWITYAFDYWGFSVAGKRAPILRPRIFPSPLKLRLN